MRKLMINSCIDRVLERFSYIAESFKRYSVGRCKFNPHFREYLESVSETIVDSCIFSSTISMAFADALSL